MDHGLLFHMTQPFCEKRDSSRVWVTINRDSSH